ncbi:MULTISPECIES: Crp/Fnr family transcriptional regulator [Paenibacillus]|uniref:Crp/Fnr family transcriptional regulator n=1 Tax=Paenibacillus TaxID=44249 RepID=UPI000B8313B8|nr:MULTISPECIES: Crp/Fnr family transcriptional regulator [Paenibacillus]PRA03604.1 Crp/Fnr family transcriptional regulator [Paenibacillus sp. MYb63]PRA47022.1 Crp/Fnr family transcriptional regulator [Paenibacillus sp. MYb67]QZN76773.1 Crp/Fnr family transcriptional regulator [Paenibacillus sp. DR312]
MDKILYLSQFDLMSSLSEADLIEMDGMTSITTIPKNRQIQTPDTFTEGFYFVKRGKVRLYTLNPEGKQFTLDMLTEGNVFGEMNGISLGTRAVYIETMEECDICLMNKQRFEQFLIEHPQFMMRLMNVLSERIKQMSELTQTLALGNLHEKVLHNLFRLAEQMGWIEEDEFCKIQLALTHQEIAWMAGATRESVTIVMQDLAKAGRIRTGFKSVSLHRDEIATLRKITAHL